VSGPITVDNANANPAQITVAGSGDVQLHESSYDPFLTRDHWSSVVVGTDISLPFWVEFLAITNGPLYIIVSTVAAVLGSDIWYQSLVEDAELSTQSGLQSALNDALPGPILMNRAMSITQMPSTNAPNWLVNASDFIFSGEGAEGFIQTNLLPPGIALGSPGNFPYLMITDQDVSDPSAIPDLPNAYGGFPQRFDGAFNWPGIAYNQSGPGSIAGSAVWDVHKLQPIVVVLKIPDGLFNPRDPSVLIEWVVRRTDTNAVIISKTLGIGQGGRPPIFWRLTMLQPTCRPPMAFRFRAISTARCRLELFRSL
jgi:hypothetical protein